MYSLASASCFCLCEPAHVSSLGWLPRALLLWDVVTEKVARLRLAGAPPLGITGTGPLGDGPGQVLCLGFRRWGATGLGAPQCYKSCISEFDQGLLGTW